MTEMQLANGTPEIRAASPTERQCQWQFHSPLPPDQHAQETWVRMHFVGLLKGAQRSPRQATVSHTDRGARLMCARVSGANNGRTIADIRCNQLLKNVADVG
jgi:hypothetical protein